MRYVFTDFDEFADAARGLNGRYVPTAASRDAWWIEPVRVGRIGIDRVQVGSPATYVGDGDAGQIAVAVPLTPPEAIRYDGQLLTSDSFVLLRHDHPLTVSSPGLMRWGALTIPMDVAATDPRFDEALFWSTSIRGNICRNAEPASLRRLTLLMGLLCGDHDTIRIVDQVAVAAAEEDVLLAAASLMRSPPPQQRTAKGRPALARNRILARAMEYLRANEGQPVRVEDLCRAANVSERTLRNVFNEFFGIGPAKFLRARQLQEIRAALLTAELDSVTVSSVATRFGVWDFSLFARNYRSLYGESPSQTLRDGVTRRLLARQRPKGTLSSASRSWIAYATRRFSGHAE